MTNESPADKRFTEAIEKLSQTLDRQNSWFRRFTLGLAGGIGTGLGATVIAGIVLYLLGSLLSQIPWHRTITGAVEDTVQQGVQDAITNR